MICKVMVRNVASVFHDVFDAWYTCELSAERLPSYFTLKVHRNENFFGSDFEFCTISLLVMLKY